MNHLLIRQVLFVRCVSIIAATISTSTCFSLAAHADPVQNKTVPTVDYRLDTCNLVEGISCDLNLFSLPLITLTKPVQNKTVPAVDYCLDTCNPIEDINCGLNLLSGNGDESLSIASGITYSPDRVSSNIRKYNTLITSHWPKIQSSTNFSIATPNQINLLSAR